MAPTLHITGTTVSPVSTLELETTIGIVQSSDSNSGTQNDINSTSPTTPEMVRVKRDRLLFQKVFDDNMKNKPVKHDKGYVLLLSWEDKIDDLNVKDEVSQLRAVFQDQYGFEVTWKKLGKEKPKRDLNLYLSSFMHAYDMENTLLIIYYAGHGVYENNSVRWQATNRQHSESEKRNCIAWSGAESNITDSAADVLVIFDCCEAAGIGGKKVRSSRASFEFIAACGERERTKRPGKTSFTSALMWSLEKLRTEAPFTSITLVDTIKKYKYLPKTQHPELLRRDEFADNLVWIAPLVNGPEPEAIAKSEHRNPHHEYIDLRFNFYRRVELHDAENLAKHLSRLVNNEEFFAAKHISLLDISSTFSKAITVWRKSSTSSKRKSISTPSTNSKIDMPDLSDLTGPIAKRQRRESLRSVTAREATEPQGALYHLRMLFHCSLQSLGSHIGRVADQVHPRMLERVDTSESLTGVDV